MSEFGDLIPEFVEESLEHLKNIEEDIIIIEQGNADNELINRVFRAVHSIKGGSSFLGLKNIEQLSHKMEDIFNSVRNNELEFSSEISSRVLRSIDKLKEMLEVIEESDICDISENLSELKKCLEVKPTADKVTKPVAPIKKIKEEIEDITIKVSKKTFGSLRKKGKKIYLIQFELKNETLDGKTPRDFFNEIEKTGDILMRNVDKGLVLKNESITGEGIPLSILYATVLEKDLVAHIFSIEEDIIKEVEPGSSVEKEFLENASKKMEEGEKNLAQEQGQTNTTEQAPVKDWLDETGLTDDMEVAVRDIEDLDLEDINEIEPIEEYEVGDIMDFEEEEQEDSDALQDINEYLTFWVGDEEYGIVITRVHEIVTLQEITPVPSAEEYTRGILNLRGDIIPVYDFRLRLNFEAREYDNETVILIVMVDTKKVGIIVDKVSEVLELTRQEITEAPQMQDIPTNFVIGIGQKDGKFIILLKLKEIFNIREAA